jgi:stress-induced morphogen
MEERLKKTIEQVTHCEVTDVSGGCGSFFKVKVVSPAFQGKSLVERNRLVYAALKDEIGEMHGLNVECATS